MKAERKLEPVKDASHLYEVERRARHAERPGFRISELQLSPTQTVPWHYHTNIADTFYVLEGEMTISVGDKTIKATPGTMVCLPRDVAHSFVIDSEQSRVLILLTPAGFEGWFEEFSVPAPAMTLPPQVEGTSSDVQKMLEASPRYGIELVLPKS